MAHLVKISVLFVLIFSGCSQTQTQVIEINSVPPPFDVNGVMPYVVWVNGSRVDMPKKDVMVLVSKIGKENIKTAKSNDIHRGWLYSYFKGDPSDELNTKKER
jgi:hypothetical protein